MAARYRGVDSHMNIKFILTPIKTSANLFSESFGSIIDRYRFSRRRLANCEPIFPAPEAVFQRPYLFVLSTGRCGTAMITHILAKSPKLRVEHNPKPELEYVSSIAQRDCSTLEAKKLAILAARFDLFFLDTFLRGKIYVETNNRISLFAPALSEIFPHAKFIHLVRDPAGFVRSGMRRGYYKGGVIQHQRLDGSSYGPWSGFSRVEKIAWEWNQINKDIEAFKAQVSSERILTINSEKFYVDPTVTHNLFEFINVDNPFDGLKGERALMRLLSKRVNEQTIGSFPDYPHWEEADKASLRRIASLSKTYGYFHT